MTNSIIAALNSLRPGSLWTLSGSSYSGLTWADPVQTCPTEDELSAEVARLAALPVPQSILSQDLMAQFTADDATKIQAAISANVQFWLLWQALTTQKDPMLVTNARFLAGWSALVSVLGQPRMNAIATMLGVTV